MEAHSPLEMILFEIAPIIAHHLSVKDLGACCATSKTMRELFQSGDVWRPRCVKYLAEYLAHTPCMVEPAFVSPENDNSSLSPVPDWRMAYMRENHLTNNWKLGRFVTNSVPKFTSISCYGSAFYSNDLVISRCPECFGIIDVSKSSPVFAVEPVHYGHSSNVLRVETCNGVAIVQKLNLVLIYKLDFHQKQCVLFNVFFYDKPLKEPIDYSDSSKICNIIREIHNKEINISRQELYDVDLPLLKSWIIEGDFFVKIVSGTHIYIWNYNTGVKLKEESCPFKICKLLSSKSLILVFGVQYKRESTYTFVAYSLTKLAYLPLKVTFPSEGLCLMIQNCILICNKGDCFIYNCETSELLLKCEIIPPVYDPWSIPDDPLKPDPRIMQDCFLFVGKDGVLKKFNPVEKRLVDLPIDYVTGFKVIGNICLRVERANMTESWWKIDFSSKIVNEILMNLDRENFYRFNNTATRCFLKRVGNRPIDPEVIFHFW